MTPGLAMPDPPETPAAKRARTDQDEAMMDTPEQALATAAVPASSATPNRDMTTVEVPHLMKMYYDRLFPHQEVYRWLAYGNDGKHPHGDSTFFQRREFCFTMQGDIFVRYQSFRDGLALAAALSSKLPSKIDLGPVYSKDASKRKLYEGSHIRKGLVMQLSHYLMRHSHYHILRSQDIGTGSGQCFPVSRELVFDIDLTDYDDVRTCGSGAHVCTRCWPLMAAAVQVLDRGLRQDFGFRHILWVFSGRRGIHCWVCDSRARRMTDEQRSAVASYFGVYAGQEKGLAKMFLRDVNHPFVSQAYETLSTVWVETILPQQQLLEDEAQRQKVLQYIPCDTTREEASRELLTAGKQARGDNVWARQWASLERVCQQAAIETKKDSLTEKRLKSAIRLAPMRIVLAYTFPRLDIEVSKKMNHLLKAPFCVHPKTGKVNLHPLESHPVPSVSQLSSFMEAYIEQGCCSAMRYEGFAKSRDARVFEVCVPLAPGTAAKFNVDTVPTVGSLLNELNALQLPPEERTGEQWRHTSLNSVIQEFQQGFLKELSAANLKELTDAAKASADMFSF